VPNLLQNATKPKPKPKRREDRSWWTTLSGLLTGVAAMLVAMGGLAVGLYQADLLHLPWNSPAPPVPPPVIPVPSLPGTFNALPKIEGVGIKIVAVRRSHDRGATFVDLHYSVITGSADFYRHDPVHFVQLISNDVALTPVWASVEARDLPPNSRQDVLVKFPSPPEARSIVFRFGEEHHLDLAAQVAD
jgi:hypothetical protein